ncbi:hypothetical protein Q9251_18965 [Alkalihalobacillus macyae]|uniref:hypothetical protein n=1 Tax=Guptibacillus hwajinpoensis TaxID=208199 RepID=UPI00273B430E|nr:hypothetical protein [Alkalihalobacillus macyae]MDP4552965.1 hypothetical protein [Alkalihalobacillus macyae]
MYKYSDEEFRGKVKDRIGNVRSFKKHLRKIGLIGNRQQFSEMHVQMFEKVRKYKEENHTTWELAFQNGLQHVSQNSTPPIATNNVVEEGQQKYLEEALNEILKTLNRIEEKL